LKDKLIGLNNFVARTPLRLIPKFWKSKFLDQYLLVSIFLEVRRANKELEVTSDLCCTPGRNPLEL